MRSLLFALAIFLQTTLAFGQFNVGLKFGVNGAGMIDDSSHDALTSDSGIRPKISVNCGFYGRYAISDKLKINGEIAYTDKGYQFGPYRDAEEGNLSLNYLNLSLITQIQLYERWALLVGPELGYMFSAISRFGEEKANMNRIWDNPFDLGIISGVSYLLTQRFRLDVRYITGLLYPLKMEVIFTDDGTSPRSEYIKYRNHLLQLNLNYTLF